MTTPPDKSGAGISIAAVERETGLSKDTLRIWERRYGFPTPQRDAIGERLYSVDQVHRLSQIKRLLDCGYRPGKILTLSDEALQALIRSQENAESSRPASQSPTNTTLTAFLTLIKSHQVELLRNTLYQTLISLGLKQFVTVIVAPLNRLVGEAWMRNEIKIFEEHLYTESVQAILRNAINSMTQSAGRPTHHPRVLLTTFPQEPHGLGILMAEALFTLEGAYCISLGVQTPIREIADAAQAKKADIVALSFSSYLSRNQVLEGLNALRQIMPTDIEIWAGGSSNALHRRPPESVKAFSSLDAIGSALAIWRAAHAKEDTAP